MKIILTRNTDVFLSLSSRAAIANKARAALFVSIHENSATNKVATGYEDYRSASAGAVTKSAHQAFHAVVANDLLKPYGIKNRGMKSASYQVLRTTNMAAILVENLFISNANDLKLQKDSKFLKAAAKAYAKAIKAALNVVVVNEKKKQPNKRNFDVNNPIVVLDAGHGGHDPGAVNGAEKESRHVMNLVNMIKAELEGVTATTVTVNDERETARKLIRRAVEDGIFTGEHLDLANYNDTQLIKYLNVYIQRLIK